MISGFATGDEISFGLLSYTSGDTVNVSAAGIVTVSAGGTVYNLHIAGAVVSSTAYQLGSGTYGLALSMGNTSATMAFIKPPVTSGAANVVSAAFSPAASKLTGADVFSRLGDNLPDVDFAGGLSGVVSSLLLSHYAESITARVAQKSATARSGIVTIDNHDGRKLTQSNWLVDKMTH